MATLEQGEVSYFSMMGEQSCAILRTDCSIKDLENNIAECEAMLSHFIKTNNKEEIAFWRKMLQSAKVQRRELLIA